MSKIVNPKIRFKPSTSPDVVAYNIRPAADYTVSPARITTFQTDPDGYVRVATAEVPFLEGVEGDVEVFVSAVDGAGNESDFLRVAGPLDLSPPAPPVDGSIE